LAAWPEGIAPKAPVGLRVKDFLIGFIKDAATREVYGRPVGLATAADGSLLVADDAGNAVWRVSAR
jgi:glucose/arabinose dehydrogenase